MSESVRSWGGIREDDGNRVVEAGRASRSDSSTRRETEHEDGGAWSEWSDADVYGEDFELPGMGESGPRCGEFFPDGVCCECGEVHFGAHRCGRRSCPDCYGLWARDAATRATVRVQMKRDTEPDDWHRQAAHFVASPPEGSIRSVRQYWNGYRDAAELAKQKGMRGFAVIGHPYRVTDEGKRLYREEMDEREDTVGIWVWLRNEYEGDWLDLVYWSPHYHVIGLTSRDMEPGGEDADDGWVWSFFRSFDRYGRYSERAHEDVYGAFRYLLSHTGWPPESTKQVVRWYGSLSTNSFTEDERPSERVQDTIRRQVEEIAGGDAGSDEGASEASEDDETRECDECAGKVIHVTDISAYLDSWGARRDDPREAVIRRRMRVARDWFFGEIEPPSNGLASPRTAEDARLAFEKMVSGR